MDSVRSYIISVVIAAMICGIVVKLVGGKGTQGAMVKLIAGSFLTFTVIRPVSQIRLGDITDITSQYSLEAQAAASEGESMTRLALCDGIKAQSEAYILDKAEELGIRVTVQISLSEDDIPVPVSIQLAGNASPYAKGRLTSIITEDLGIPKEDQTWI